MAFRFLHAADIHLDSPLQGLQRYEDAPIDRIRGATRRAFSALVDRALERRVDFVVIAGDLFDGDWRDYNTGLFLTGQLRRLREADVPVVMIAGNHDAANRMTRSLPLPDNVTMMGHARAETKRLDRWDVAIHGQSFARQAVCENLAAGYPRADSGLFNLGLLHTCLGGVEGHERYSPCTPAELDRLDYGYWALGHVHGRSSHGDGVPIEFAGNPQGRHAREVGPKGCLLVEVGAAGTARVTFERLDVVRWEVVRVDATGLDGEDDLHAGLDAALRVLLADEAGSDRLLAVRLRVEGPTILDDRLRGDGDRTSAALRSVANGREPGRLWVEKVEVATRRPSREHPPDGPMAELESIIRELRSDPAAIGGLVPELDELRKRLPTEVDGLADRPLLVDPDWLNERLDEVLPLLGELLRDAGRPSP